MNKILSMYNSLSNWRVKIPRLLDARKEMKMKQGQLDVTMPNSDNMLLINELWGG